MKISVVIPAFNEQEALTRVLSQLYTQSNLLHEIIVVDDGSNPPLVVPEWAILVRAERTAHHRSAGPARNAGAARATGDWLLFCDSGILIPRDAVASAMAAVHYKRFDLILGSWLGLLPEYHLPSTDVDDIIDDLGLPIREVNIDHQFALLSRNNFEKLGGYDEVAFKSWGLESQDLTVRALAAGLHLGSPIMRLLRPTQHLVIAHPWHPAPRDGVRRREEFAAKWGEPFTNEFIARILARGKVN